MRNEEVGKVSKKVKITRTQTLFFFLDHYITREKQGEVGWRGLGMNLCTLNLHCQALITIYSMNRNFIKWRTHDRSI